LTGFSALLIAIGSILPDLDVIPSLFGVAYRKTHRTLFHSIFMPLIVSLFSTPLAIGVSLHLLVDLLTYPGIKLFYPLSQKEFYFIRGDYIKYHDFKLFIKDVLNSKRYLAIEFSLLFIGAVLFFI
jgi:membrane-bound metal-dependent hydrolase YbcI (DUF457 family)